MQLSGEIEVLCKPRILRVTCSRRFHKLCMGIFLLCSLLPSAAEGVDASECPCLDNGGQPTQRCPCDVAGCYRDCVDVLCPSFPQCTFECSRRCYCGTGAPLCPTHEDPGPTPTAAPTCAGDCDDDGRTTVDEVLQGVSVVLGMATVDTCQTIDRNGDGQGTIEEVVKALNTALYGCVRSASTAPTATPSPVLSSTRTVTSTPTPITDPVLQGLIDVLDTLCFDRGFIHGVWATGHDGSYSFSCLPGPGHATAGSLTLLADPLAASEALDVRLAAHSPDSSHTYEFHGLPALQWERDVDLLPFNDRPEYHGVVWVAGCWLVDVNAFDDTHFWLLPPTVLSEALFKDLVETDLIGDCPEGESTHRDGKLGD